MCPVGQLHPRFGQRRLRIRGTAEDPGKHGEALGLQDRVLGGPVGLFGVDVGHVFARIDRVHVARLRRRDRTTVGQFGTHRSKKLPRQAADKSRPGVAGGPVAVDLANPLVRRGVVGSDRQQHVTGQGDPFQLVEKRIGGRRRLTQRARRVHPPARRIMRRHVVGEQAPTRWRNPLELAAKLHPLDTLAPAALRGTPLVVRSTRPRARRQAGVGGHPRELWVVAEHVELPRGGRVGAQHVTLKTDAVHQITNGRLWAGEICVGFVIGSAHHFHPALRQKPAQVGAVLRMGVPVGLEVVDFGQHELVVGIAARHLEMGVHQLEPIGLTGAPGRFFVPLAGVGPLGVPPHRVVVEVADHEHRPARLGHGERECAGCAGGIRPDPRIPPLSHDGVLEHNRHLEDFGPHRGEGLSAQAGTVDTD